MYEWLTLPAINDRGSWFIEGACPMNTTTHSVVVPFPQAFASPARSSFPCAPRYGRNRVPPLQSIRQAVRRVCAPLRDFTLAALHCFLANTVVFLPLALRQRTHRNAILLSRCYRPILTQGMKSGSRGYPCTFLFIPAMNGRGFLKSSL